MKSNLIKQLDSIRDLLPAHGSAFQHGMQFAEDVVEQHERFGSDPVSTTPASIRNKECVAKIADDNGYGDVAQYYAGQLWVYRQHVQAEQPTEGYGEATGHIVIVDGDTGTHLANKLAEGNLEIWYTRADAETAAAEHDPQYRARVAHCMVTIEWSTQ